VNAGSALRTVSVVAAILCLAAASGTGATEVTLQVGITGQNDLSGLQDPVTVARMPEVSELLQAVADQPRTADYVERSLDSSEASVALLVDLGLLKPWQGRYAISFNYLTIEDHDMLLAVLAPFAESLAQSYRDRWPEFEAVFRDYDARGVASGEIAYAMIGAMSLDWDGLDITAEKDLRITANNLPEGRDFVIWAKEQSRESNAKELYWGSHNEEVNGIRFTTFGDHYTMPRLALPDLLWNASSRVADIEDAPRSLRLGVYRALEPYYQHDFLTDAGAVLRVLRQGAVTSETVSAMTDVEKVRADRILELLEELQYVRESTESYVLVTPFFSLADRGMIDAARALSWELMDEWLDRNYSDVRASLDGLTAIRYGVPYRQLFTEIWHYLFGLTNRELVRSGHFADPYAEERLSKGMIPFVLNTGLLELRPEDEN